MEPACPKCSSDDFDVLDEDVDIIEKYVDYECSCNKCGRTFLIKTVIVIESIL
jgi:hypothetical protein